MVRSFLSAEGYRLIDCSIAAVAPVMIATASGME